MFPEERALGCLYGLAFGDAFGAPTEFLSVNEILGEWPISGPVDLEGDPARVTDDTQMTLAVGDALVEAKSSGSLSPETLEPALRRSFVRWLEDPENDRAPGMTCLRACRRLKAGRSWQEATEKQSKGCGANMRVAPVALVQAGANNPSEGERAAMAQFQAAMTHGHPTALAASDLTVRTVTEILEGREPKELVARLQNYAWDQREVYHRAWLGDIWRGASDELPEQFIARGWDECLSVLKRVEAALVSPDYDEDPCLATGAGWVAEEALATGLFCFLLNPDQPKRALQRAAVTSGDSDSIACLTGAFAGAYLGIGAWPVDWQRRIEYGDRLMELAASLIR